MGEAGKVKQIYVLAHQQARQRASQACQDAPEGHVVTICEPTRSLDQNAALWPLLGEIASQVQWHGMKLTQAEWKDMLTASLKRQKAVPSLDGNGFVVVGASTSKMTKKDFSDLLTLAEAFAAEHGVIREQG